jgi:hypothetical protein
MSNTEEQNYSQITSSNYRDVNDPTFIKLKLDTSPLVERTKEFISGKRTEYLEDKEGNIVSREIVVGQPYANEEGVRAIVNLTDMSANNHSVQGNLNREEYYNFISNTRKELTLAIVLNCYEWEIDETKLGMIIDNLMRFIKLFLSRTIDNKERESLMSQFQTREVITQPKKKGMMQDFTSGLK